MIERYTLPEMGAIWTDEARMQAWLDVEIAAVKAWNRLGKIPDDAVAEIEAKAAFDVARVNEIEATTNHDVIAFLTNVAEYVGDASKWVHYGMTSSDMLDTALALQLKQAGLLLERDLVALGEVLKRRAFEFRDTVEVGRTHGIHAEPITFGMKLGIWAFEVSRHLAHAYRHRNAAVGKISGAVGAYNNIDPARRGPTSARNSGWAASPSQPDRPARPPRRVLDDDRRHRLGWRSSPPRSVISSGPRCWKPRSTSRKGQKGSLGHAAQAQPHHLRARRRPLARAPRQRSRGDGERRALARARHHALAPSNASSFPTLHPPRLHARAHDGRTGQPARLPGQHACQHPPDPRADVLSGASCWP